MQLLALILASSLMEQLLVDAQRPVLKEILFLVEQEGRCKALILILRGHEAVVCCLTLKLLNFVNRLDVVFKFIEFAFAVDLDRKFWLLAAVTLSVTATNMAQFLEVGPMLVELLQLT